MEVEGGLRGHVGPRDEGAARTPGDKSRFFACTQQCWAEISAVPNLPSGIELLRTTLVTRAIPLLTVDLGVAGGACYWRRCTW